MRISEPQLRAVWRTVLELSKVGPGQNVLVLTSQNSNPSHIDMALGAAGDLGATAARLEVQPQFESLSVGSDPTTIVGRSPIDGNPMAVTAMKAADLVIDLIFLLFTPAQKDVLASGTRILLVYEPPEVLARIVPTMDDRRRVLAAKATYGRGKTIHVTSKLGTDLVARIGDYPITAEYGFADEPGRWDHWPSGFVARVPNDDTAQGVVVLGPGDAVLPFKSYIREPVRLEIKNGYITSIEGGLDAEYLRDYISSFGDRNAYGVSHLGWGLQPRAAWTSLGMYGKSETIGMEARAFYGNFLFSTGPGGTRETPCHLDIPMRNCSFYVDNQPMVSDGDVVPEDQRVDRAGQPR